MTRGRPGNHTYPRPARMGLRTRGQPGWHADRREADSGCPAVAPANRTAAAMATSQSEPGQCDSTVAREADDSASRTAAESTRLWCRPPLSYSSHPIWSRRVVADDRHRRRHPQQEVHHDHPALTPRASDPRAKKLASTFALTGRPPIYRCACTAWMSRASRRSRELGVGWPKAQAAPCPGTAQVP